MSGNKPLLFINWSHQVFGMVTPNQFTSSARSNRFVTLATPLGQKSISSSTPFRKCCCIIQIWHWIPQISAWPCPFWLTDPPIQLSLGPVFMQNNFEILFPLPIESMKVFLFFKQRSWAEHWDIQFSSRKNLVMFLPILFICDHYIYHTKTKFNFIGRII